MLKVAKFGGSSMADSNQFNKIKKIIESDPERRVVVVSAPGKRFSNDHKVTDLLYLCHAHSKYGVSSYSTFSKVAKRYRTIAQSLDLHLDLDTEFSKLQLDIDAGLSEDEVVSRGEYYGAKLMAEYLGFTFIDSKEWLRFSMDGSIDLPLTYKTLKKLVGRKKVVLPGFYGSMPDGEIKLLSRGGSDITGALAAAALGADVYENWTDVDGVLMADPHMVKNPRPIKALNYDELRELAYAGAQVLHEQTIFPVLETKIPVNIRNVNNPECEGTLILSDTDNYDKKNKNTSKNKRDKSKPASSTNELITGIAGNQDFVIISIVKYQSSKNQNMQKQVLEILDKYKIGDVLLINGVDTLDCVIPGELANKYKYVVISEIESTVKPDKLNIVKDVALLNIVGRKMASHVGADSLIFSALAANNIDVKFTMKRSNGISILVGIDNSNFSSAVKALFEVTE